MCVSVSSCEKLSHTRNHIGAIMWMIRTVHLNLYTLFRLPIKNHVSLSLLSMQQVVTKHTFIRCRINMSLDAWVNRLGIAWFFISSLIRVCRSRWTVRIIHKISLIWFSHEAYFEKVSHLKIFLYIYPFLCDSHESFSFKREPVHMVNSNELLAFLRSNPPSVVLIYKFSEGKLLLPLRKDLYLKKPLVILCQKLFWPSFSCTYPLVLTKRQYRVWRIFIILLLPL